MIDQSVLSCPFCDSDVTCAAPLWPLIDLTAYLLKVPELAFSSNLYISQHKCLYL